MPLLWPIVRKALSDIWEEAFYLALFNMLWVAGAVPGLLLITYGVQGPFLGLVLLGLLALVPWPFVTFGLFHTAHEIDQGKAIGLKTFFRGGRQRWRQAYLWGGLNALIVAVLLANIRFYSSPISPLGNTSLGTMLSAFFASLTLLWLLWQLMVLTIYPRLETPGLRLALRNAAILMLAQPLPVVFVGFLALVLGLTAFVVPLLGFLSNFALIAVLANRATTEILNQEEKRREALKKRDSDGRR
ncbi:MAG: hypothetical protein ACE5H9_15045 [Anaerolineae bacterium]